MKYLLESIYMWGVALSAGGVLGYILYALFPYYLYPLPIIFMALYLKEQGEA